MKVENRRNSLSRNDPTDFCVHRETANERFCKLLACSSFPLLQKNADLGVFQGVHWSHAGPFWASDSPYVVSYNGLQRTLSLAPGPGAAAAPGKPNPTESDQIKLNQTNQTK